VSRVFSNFNPPAAAATPAFPIGYPRRLRPGPRLPPQPDKRHRGHIVDTRHTDPTHRYRVHGGRDPAGPRRRGAATLSPVVSPGSRGGRVRARRLVPRQIKIITRHQGSVTVLTYGPTIKTRAVCGGQGRYPWAAIGSIASARTRTRSKRWPPRHWAADLCPSALRSTPEPSTAGRSAALEASRSSTRGRQGTGAQWAGLSPWK
jgi:hypothetical protein